MSFRNFCLGLLVQQPMSGYDIKCLLGQLDWLIGGSSFGNIYPTLHALLQDGLASVDVVDNHDKPPKKVYETTTNAPAINAITYGKLNTVLKSFPPATNPDDV